MASDLHERVAALLADSEYMVRDHCADAIIALVLEAAARVAWLQSKQGATHDQIAAAIRALGTEAGDG